MLKLFQFHPVFGVRNLSPFCLKLETYLRMTGVEHEVVWATGARNAPKGKLPYIEDGDRVLADSDLIIEDLIGRFGDRLDGTLDSMLKAQSLAWRKLCEDSLIYPILFSRWIDPAGWALMQHLFDPVPEAKRALVASTQQESVRQRLAAQGMGAHSREEIYAFGLGYLAAIETRLGASPYMLGAKPTRLDATAYGFLANLVDTNFDNPLNHKARNTRSFVAYCQRMKHRYFPELDPGA